MVPRDLPGALQIVVGFQSRSLKNYLTIFAHLWCSDFILFYPQFLRAQRPSVCLANMFLRVRTGEKSHGSLRLPLPCLPRLDGTKHLLFHDSRLYSCSGLISVHDQGRAESSGTHLAFSIII